MRATSKIWCMWTIEFTLRRGIRVVRKETRRILRERLTLRCRMLHRPLCARRVVDLLFEGTWLAVIISQLVGFSLSRNDGAEQLECLPDACRLLPAVGRYRPPRKDQSCEIRFVGRPSALVFPHRSQDNELTERRPLVSPRGVDRRTT